MAQMAVVLLKRSLLGGVVGWHRWRWCCSSALFLAVLWDGTDGGGAAQAHSARLCCGRGAIQASLGISHESRLQTEKKTLSDIVSVRHTEKFMCSGLILQQFIRFWQQVDQELSML